MISMVVATDKNGVIGRENKIPWRLKSDLAMLKSLTKNHTVILGRKTYDSMLWYYDRSGRPMPGKTYIVVTRNQDYLPERENAIVAHSIEEALGAAKGLGDNQVFVIGGGGIFEAMLPYADRIYLTEVQIEAGGDAYFPALSPNDWKEISREHHQQDDKNDHDYDTMVLERL